MKKHEGMASAVWLIDSVFRTFAENNSEGRGGLSVEEVVEGFWSLFEQGFLRLVESDDMDRIGVEQCSNRAERRAVAKQNRPAVEFRRRYGVTRPTEDAA